MRAKGLFDRFFDEVRSILEPPKRYPPINEAMLERHVEYFLQTFTKEVLNSSKSVRESELYLFSCKHLYSCNDILLNAFFELLQKSAEQERANGNEEKAYFFELAKDYFREQQLLRSSATHQKFLEQTAKLVGIFIKDWDNSKPFEENLRSFTRQHLRECNKTFFELLKEFANDERANGNEVAASNIDFARQALWELRFRIVQSPEEFIIKNKDKL